MRTTSLFAGLFLATTAVAETPVLTVYTYDSFVSDWGPGPAVEAAFEATCGCDLQMVGAGDGAALLARLKLEGSRTDADIILGLDTNLTAAAADTGLFAPISVTANYAVPGGWADPLFAPFDWGYFAFVKNAELESPTNFRALADSDLKIVIQDPRSSTPGLGLLMWVKAAYGNDAAEIWADLSDNIVTVTAGWSEAYGMFLEGEADMVLSYTTSPAYHLIAEGDASKSFAVFDEGHYMQIEVAGKLASSDQSALADQFLQFMVSDAFQSIIPTTNWMFPAVTPAAGLPDGFPNALSAAQSLIFSPTEAAALRNAALGGMADSIIAIILRIIVGGAVLAALLLFSIGTAVAVATQGQGLGALGAADWSAIRFSLWQACLSAGLSVRIAIPVARALARQSFVGRQALITLLGAPFILPVIVGVLGLLAVFGRAGWISDALTWAGFAKLSIYGAPGVILGACVFQPAAGDAISAAGLGGGACGTVSGCAQLGSIAVGILSSD